MKIALAGAGYIIDIHAKAALAHQDIRLVAVVDQFPAQAAALAQKFDIPNQYETVEQLLETGNVDALVIGTPNYLHAPQAMAALRAGVRVLVEKPMAMNAREASKMLEASMQSGAVLMVAHCWRFDKEVLWLRKQAKRLGKIIRTKGYGVHVHWGPSGWFTEKRFAGGGAVADMGIHALDTARFLLGDPRPVSVYARIGNHYKDLDVDDTGVIVVGWDNGATSLIESGWWQPHVDGPEAATQLYGVNGFGQLFPTRMEVATKRAGAIQVIEPGFEHPRKEHAPQGMYNAQMAYFLECIDMMKTPIPGALEGLTNMAVVDAAYRSARTGRVVDLK